MSLLGIFDNDLSQEQLIKLRDDHEAKRLVIVKKVQERKDFPGYFTLRLVRSGVTPEEAEARAQKHLEKGEMKITNLQAIVDKANSLIT